MLVALSVQNFVLLASAVVPPVLAIVVCYSLWRWAKRTDEREAQERARLLEQQRGRDVS